MGSGSFALANRVSESLPRGKLHSVLVSAGLQEAGGTSPGSVTSVLKLPPGPPDSSAGRPCVLGFSHTPLAPRHTTALLIQAGRNVRGRGASGTLALWRQRACGHQESDGDPWERRRGAGPHLRLYVAGPESGVDVSLKKPLGAPRPAQVQCNVISNILRASKTPSCS